MECPRCRRSSLVEIKLTAGERNIRLRSCSRCDSRWWDRDGEGVGVDAVIALASAR